MSRIVYVNGDYLAEEAARISVFDRGFLFADAVYEVSAVLRGRLVDNAAHLARLHRSLKELEIPPPASDEDIVEIQRTLIERNGLEEGVVYLQVTRGAADRDFAFPTDIPPGLVMFTQAEKLVDRTLAAAGIAVASTPDIRWKRRDIKTVGLLAASMAKTAAKRAGADDAWFVEDGYVTEGSSNNAFIVTADGSLVTRQLGNEILHGITRAAILSLSEESGIPVEERRFTLDEAYAAREAFITSASTFALGVVRIDGRVIGDGKPGPVTRRLRELYIDAALADIAPV
jgi:D-alanine transaminase